MRDQRNRSTWSSARRRATLGESLRGLERLEARTLLSGVAAAVTGSQASVSSLPAPWSGQDIGGPALKGSASVSGGAFTVRGAGTDIWNTADQFQFVSQALSGNGTLVARVSSQTNTDPWAKAGLMIRTSTDPGSAFVDLVQTPGNGVALQWRSTAGSAPSAWTAGPTFSGPVWLKLTRSGSTFTGSVSADGVNYTTVGSVSVAMPSGVLAGLAVTSHNASAISTATFDGVALTSAPAAAGAGIALGNGFGASAGLLTLNGSAVVSGSTLTLTDGHHNQSASVFSAQPVSIGRFQTAFAVQLSHASGDGITFTIQGNAPTSLGTSGGGLGFQGIGRSVAIKLDLYDNAGEGADSTGLYTNGAAPTTPSVNLTPSGVNLHSGDIFVVAMTYDGSALKVTITDTKTGASASQSYAVDIPSLVGGPNAYVGFTGATGGAVATQQVLNWSFTPAATPTPTGGQDTVAPSSPANLSLTQNSDTVAAIRWDAATDNVGVAAYTIYRNGAKVATVAGGATSYTDSGLTPGATYTYVVTASDDAGNTSGPSNSLSVTMAAASNVPAPSLPGTWNLAFNDNFDSVNPAVWSNRYWWDGNLGTQATFNPSNVSTSNGILSLTANKQTATASNGTSTPYTSGLLTTGGIQGATPASFTFTYGYIETRSKIAPGQGMWSALWLLPADYNDNFELDVFENLGKSPNVDQGFLHAFGAGRFAAVKSTGTDLTQGFHTYGVDWEPDHISWYLDGQEIARDTNTSYIPNRPMYMILNLDVGGDWAGPLTSASPAQSSWQLDYLRVWQHPTA